MADKRLEHLFMQRRSARAGIMLNINLGNAKAAARMRRRMVRVDWEIAQLLHKREADKKAAEAKSGKSASVQHGSGRVAPSKAEEPPKIDWPIPLTPATPHKPEPAEVLRRTTAADAQNKPQAPLPTPGQVQHVEAPQCPVCHLPLLEVGRSRHQKCERFRTQPNGALADETPAALAMPSDEDSAATAYRTLVRKVERREADTYGRRRERVSGDPVRLQDARRAVLMRSQGRCENPACGGQPGDLTDDGQAILEVDHVERIAEGGRDHPAQMVALCPNCHAMKERGAGRAALRSNLMDVARRRHNLWHTGLAE
ncbi:HNH endonuclease [Streptomyces sp. NPDC050433]|uniref:HNH endonuclease n=1 Tax=Streptomyces sp. NPDC050433 TaxID=3365615 RepID=UPI0037A59A3A